MRGLGGHGCAFVARQMWPQSPQLKIGTLTSVALNGIRSVSEARHFGHGGPLAAAGGMVEFQSKIGWQRLPSSVRFVAAAVANVRPPRTPDKTSFLIPPFLLGLGNIRARIGA